MPKHIEPDVLFSRLLVDGVGDMLKTWRRYNDDPVAKEMPAQDNPATRAIHHHLMSHFESIINNRRKADDRS